MKGFVGNIEEITLLNEYFREVLFTGAHCQLVVMSLKPLEEIGMEVHPDNDQFFRFESGQGQVTSLLALAVARLYLDNFRHIKSFWIMVGPKLAQISLHFGVDDIDGTVVEEKITHAAGAQAGQEMSVAELVTMIRQAGRIPVERDTLYNVVREWPAEGPRA